MHTNRMAHSLFWFLAICWAPLIGHAQILTPDKYPEELTTLPRLLDSTCAMSYSAKVQPSPFVLQKDPKNRDFLEVLKGETALSHAQNPNLDSQTLRYPTFHAKLPLVVGRITYLVGANYQRSDTEYAIRKGITYLSFEGTNYYTRKVKVRMRVTAFLKNTKVKQYLLGETPTEIRLGGPCGPFLPEYATGRIVSEPYYNLNSTTFAEEIVFPQAGPYIIRTELVYHDPNQANIANLVPTGIAVDVLGEVVAVSPPLFQVNSAVFGNRETPQELQAIQTRTKFEANRLSELMQEYLPIASKPVPVKAAKTLTKLNLQDGFTELARKLIKAKRFSDPEESPERIVALVRYSDYETIVRRITPLGKPAPNYKYCEKGILWSKQLIILSAEYSTTYDLLWKNEGLHGSCLEKFAHSLGRWDPGKNEPVGPYHNMTRKVAYGIKQDSYSAPYPLVEGGDLMEQYRGGAPSQATYMHFLDALTATKVDPPVIMVSGEVSVSGLSKSATLDPLYQMDGFSELEEQGPGSWHILLKDAQGQVLADYPFEPDFLMNGGFQGQGYFNYTVLDHPDVARVEITAPFVAIGGSIQKQVDAIDYSPNPPIIWDFKAIPGLSDYTIQWAGYDQDWDNLSYTLLMSDDGLVYEATDLSESAATAIQMEIPASISHLKLIVTDGARSTTRVLQL